MEKVWLEAQLAAGRSIEDIAREVGRAPSTVAYWVNTHGLVSQHAERHRARGGIAEGELREMVERGLSIREIARERGVSATSVRHWLRKFGLKTSPARYGPRGTDKPPAVLRECRTHGWTEYVLSRNGRYYCRPCRTEAVIRRRRKVKEILVAEAGGRCVACGYNRYAGALQFHHVDPSEKSFEIGGRGLTRAIEELRAEVRKCVLVCATCHAELEAGVATIPAG